MILEIHSLVKYLDLIVSAYTERKEVTPEGREIFDNLGLIECLDYLN